MSFIIEPELYNNIELRHVTTCSMLMCLLHTKDENHLIQSFNPCSNLVQFELLSKMLADKYKITYHNSKDKTPMDMDYYLHTFIVVLNSYAMGNCDIEIFTDMLRNKLSGMQQFINLAKQHFDIDDETYNFIMLRYKNN